MGPEEVVEKEMRAFFGVMELNTAIWLAQEFNPEMARRYLHTKKRRTRKKCEKRLRAWYREVFL